METKKSRKYCQSQFLQFLQFKVWQQKPPLLVIVFAGECVTGEQVTKVRASHCDLLKFHLHTKASDLHLYEWCGNHVYLFFINWFSRKHDGSRGSCTRTRRWWYLTRWEDKWLSMAGSYYMTNNQFLVCIFPFLFNTDSSSHWPHLEAWDSEVII